MAFEERAKTRPTYVITGASGGLGMRLIEGLSPSGDIIATYHTQPRTSPDARVCWSPLDVSDTASVEQFVERHRSLLNRIVLLNLAGLSLDGIAHKLTDDKFDRVIATNVRGAFLMSRALLPFMREQGWGRIINVSSIVAEIGVPGTIAYATSKAALHAMARTIAAENATKGVTANTIALGYFNEGMMLAFTEEQQERIVRTIPARRLGTPEEFCAAIEFVVTCGYLTGTTIDINGGLY